MDHRSLRREAETNYHERLARHGTLTPAEDERADKKLAKRIADHEVERGIEEHDEQLHGGKKTRLHLADGGCAEGGRTHRRHDRPGRAAGGGMPHLGGKKGHGGKGHSSHVAVIVNPGQGPARPVPVPVPAAGIGGGGMPPVARPPMAPMAPPMAGGAPGMGMRPPGMMPGAPGMMRASGGKVPEPTMLDAGASSGKGRLEKAAGIRKMRSAALTGPY